eukprot:1667724-Amphidinium_carterae.1
MLSISALFSSSPHKSSHIARPTTTNFGATSVFHTLHLKSLVPRTSYVKAMALCTVFVADTAQEDEPNKRYTPGRGMQRLERSDKAPNVMKL